MRLEGIRLLIIQTIPHRPFPAGEKEVVHIALIRRFADADVLQEPTDHRKRQ